MFGHDDHHEDDNKEEAVTISPVTSDTTVDTPTTSNPAPSTPTEELTTEDTSPAPDDVMDSSDPADADLLNLKKQALEELSPLVEHLDQTPEEKFKTTMMLIQATDSSNLIKDAHQAALAITDEKARAQALLDIVNEINYFTQK